MHRRIPHYADAALSVYIKAKALGQRPEACTAGVATLASYLHLCESTLQRGLAQLRAALAWAADARYGL